MNEWIESADGQTPTVSVWTPWGEQKVLKADNRATAQRRYANRRRDDVSPPQGRLDLASFGV